MWWGEEIWRWVWGPGVGALRTGVDLGIWLVAVVEWRGVLAHGRAVSRVARGWEDDLLPIAMFYIPPDRRETSEKKGVAVAGDLNRSPDRE